MTRALTLGRRVAGSGASWLVAGVALWLVEPGLVDDLAADTVGARPTFYSTLAGVSATLLGFLVASVAFLSVLPDEQPLAKRVRSEGLLRQVVEVFVRTAVAMSLLVISALIGLLVDVEVTSARGAQQPMGATWIVVPLAVAVPAGARLVECVVLLGRAAGAAAR